METDPSQSSQDVQDSRGSNYQTDLDSEDHVALEQDYESTHENMSNEFHNQRSDSPMFSQSVRETDRRDKFRAANRKLKEQKAASLKAALDDISKKEELQDIKRRGMDGDSDGFFAQLKKENTEISMQIIDHKSERLKRAVSRNSSKKGDDFFHSVQSATQSFLRLPELQQACWQVTNFVPLKVHNPTQSAAAQASQVREVTEDPAVLKALRNLFDLLEGFSSQSEEFLSMLCKDTTVAVVAIPAGTRAATKGDPMTRTLVLLSGQAHKLSYSGESHILLEESHSTRMKVGDSLGFIDDDEELVQENAFTIACQTSCSFLEISKSSFDEIYNQIKFERFILVMNISPDDRLETDVEFLCNFAKKNAFFKQLKGSRQLNLCRQARMEQWKFDDVLFNEDDRGQLYYIIIRGSVRVLKNVGGALDNQGNKIFQQVALLGPGVGFGELAILSSSGVRQATVVANENSVFMTLSRKTYNEVLRGEHEHSLNETIRAIIHVFPYVGQRDRIFQTYMAQLFREEELPAGHVVAKQGEKAFTFYILKEGSLSIDCRVEFSRFSPPEEAGFLHTEGHFETKTLKKFTHKEHKARLVPFGELSAFGDTIGDMDMLANPIWAATYMYRATVSKPAVLCSISWAALKVRFPPEMLEDLLSRSLKKFSLFKRIFNSAVATECSNSKFSCLSDFNPIGYVQKKSTEESTKCASKLSLGEQLEGKKTKLRRHVRSRMDVPAAQAFQITVNEWIVDMSHDNVLRSIETVTDDMKKTTGVELNTLESLLLLNNAQKDEALDSLMRSAFLDKGNIDFCIDNIIKTTRTTFEHEETELSGGQDASRASQRLALKSAETGIFSPNSTRNIRTPIPGHKPQFVRYDLTEQSCNIFEEYVARRNDFVMLDSSIVQTRPSSRATAQTSQSKTRRRAGSSHRFDASICYSGDEAEDYHRYGVPVDDYSSDASIGPNCQLINPGDSNEGIPEYFYPAHYKIKSSKNRRAKNRGNDVRKHQESKLRSRTANSIPFETAIIATPIQFKSTSADVKMAPFPSVCSSKFEEQSPVADHMQMPLFDEALLSVKSLQHEVSSFENSRVTRLKLNLTQAASNAIIATMKAGVSTLEPDCVHKSVASAESSEKGSRNKASVFTREKKNEMSFDHSKFAVSSDDDDHNQGVTCSPDTLASLSSSTKHPDTDEQRSMSKEEKMKQILTSSFTLVRNIDDDSQKMMAESLEKLKQDHAQAEKRKLQAETKSKLANLFSLGLLDNRIKHLEPDNSEHPKLQLPSEMLEKMNDIVIRRRNDPQFKGQKFELKLQSAITPTANAKKSAASPTTFDFDGCNHTFSDKCMKFDDIVRGSYHHEQMLKIQNRNVDQNKTNRQQLLKNVLSKSNRGPSIGTLHIGSVVLPPVLSASPKHQKR